MKNKIDYDFESAKKEWHQICEEHEDMPIYQKDWFWDAAADSPDDWRVIIYKSRDIIAAFPFLYHKIHGMWRIEAPWQVARSGLWLSMQDGYSLEKKIHVLKDIVSHIVENLPGYDYFNINFNTDFDNWSPFYWSGFTSSVNYTYTISHRRIEDIKGSFSRRRRQRVNQGQKKYEIRNGFLDAGDVWDFYEKSYEGRQREIAFSRERFLKLMDGLERHGAMQIKSAHQGENVAAVEVVLVDSGHVYHQFCTHLAECPDAQTLVVYDTIVYAMETGRKFDFEGSMIKGPAEFYISFLPDTEICYCIHDESRKYRILTGIREVIRLIAKSIAEKLSGGGYDFSAEKERWRELCAIEENIPIYFRDWFWDAVCDSSDDWWVILIEEQNGEIEAAFPFVYAKRKGMYFIETPWQVAAAGIWMKHKEWGDKEKELKHLSHLVEKILGYLPCYDRFSVIFNADMWTWQPFYWQGFSAVPFYTMTIAGIDEENVKSSICKSRRKRVSRGEREFSITVNELSFEEYWNFFEMSYSDRDRVISYEKEKFEKLIKKLSEHGSMQMRGVYKESELVAVNIVLFDSKRVYHQFGTQKRSADASAASYGIYDAICDAMKQGKTFDFEGSMIPGVCEFNSSFNPNWEIQYRIENYSDKYIILESLRRIFLTVRNSVHSKKLMRE